MAKQTTDQVGDDTPVTGGVFLPESLISPLPSDDDAPDDDLGRQVYWLLKLNADKVPLRFRPSDLAAMDDDSKRQLIADIQQSLGIAPFKKSLL